MWHYVKVTSALWDINSALAWLHCFVYTSISLTTVLWLYLITASFYWHMIEKWRAGLTSEVWTYWCWCRMRPVDVLRTLCKSCGSSLPRRWHNSSLILPTVSDSSSSSSSSLTWLHHCCCCWCDSLYYKLVSKSLSVDQGASGVGVTKSWSVKPKRFYAWQNWHAVSVEDKRKRVYRRCQAQIM